MSNSPSVRVYPPGYGHGSYQSDYQPWLEDVPFLSTWQRVRDNTLLDLPRLYTLWDMVEQATRRSDGAVLEVGVWRGGSGALMGYRMAACGTSRPLYLADTFSGVVKAGDRDSYYRGGEHSDTSVDRVRDLVDSLEIPSCHVLPGIFPDETGARIAENTLAFCHIDVDVYQSARDVFEWAWPRISPGGVVVFDDYGFYGCDGVTDLIRELRSENDRIVVPTGNGQALVVKV